MGLLDMNAQPQQQMMGGLLGGGMAQGGMQGGGMPPEMMKIVQQIKSAPPEDKEQMVQMIVESIQGQNKPEQEKMQAINQLMTAIQ